MSENLTAFIFARGGSKGVKDKNVRLVGGKPLISYAINAGLASNAVSRVIVSTDSEKIAGVAVECGADVLMRPAALADDDTSEVLAWRHAIEQTPEVNETGIFISLPATSPLRSPDDIDAGVVRFQNGDCDIVFGISEATHNPYLSMAVINDNDLLDIAVTGATGARRQDMPETYDINGCVYVAAPDYVMKCDKLINGRVGYIKIPQERTLDIDTEFDLHVADLLLTNPFGGS